MSQRKIALLLVASLVMIAGSYLLTAPRAKPASAPMSQTTIGLDDSNSALHMKTTDELIAFWKLRFQRDPKDFISLTYLGQTYMRKGRETGDASEYERADAVLRKAIELDPQYEPALAYLSADLFVKHDFRGALELANQVYATDPRALQALATAGDAQLELGRYTEAAAAYDLLAQKHAGAAVYSRQARIAWLHGHTAEALSLMQKAVVSSQEVGLSGENAAWYHFQLGELFFNTNDLQQADAQFTAALQQFDNYYLALAGLGKVRAAQGRYTEAIAYYERAVAIIPQPDFLAALGDLYTVAGVPEKANHAYDTVALIGKLQAINQVIYNRQLALFDANHDLNLEDSLSLAQNELADRRDIYGYDTVAWALYKNGRYAQALEAMQQAMKLGTRDALLYYHAGMIYDALGDTAQAQDSLSQAMALNPHFDLLQARIASEALANLQAHGDGSLSQELKNQETIMRKIRRVAVLLLTLLASFSAVPVAFAHPLGNFTINHYAGLHVSRDKIAVDFVLDMAEIPAFQEIATFDANGNGKPDSEESAGYHPAACEAIRSELDLRLDGKPVALRLESSSMAFPPGAGGLSTLRLTCEFSSAIATNAKKGQIYFADNSYADRIGWREIVVTADQVSVAGNYASTSLSQRLTVYPADMLTDPLNQRQVTFSMGDAVASADADATAPVVAQPAGTLANRNNAFTQLITVPNITLLNVLFAMLVSFVWGAMHALTPGHGKTVVGAYLVGSRGTARHAFYLGLTTTITHTAGVIALGLVTFVAARFILPEQFFPWLSAASGLLVAGIGLKMLVDRMRNSQPIPQPASMPHPGHEHQDVVPAHVPHGHDHAQHRYVTRFHEHEHSVDDHAHAHAGHTHRHDHVVDDHHTHAHLPPGAQGEPITWRNLLALGISGGILPCPDALIVLLSAVALGRVAFGLILVIAFSTGLAAALSAVGLLFVYAGRIFQLSPKQGKLLRLMPAASALVITVAGLGVTATAISQMGWAGLMVR